MSSATAVTPMYISPSINPNDFSSSSSIRSSSKILYSGVDRTPPCLTPCFNAKLSLNEPNHFTFVVKPLYSSLMINQYVGLMFLSSSLSRRIVCCTTSNADCTSNVAKKKKKKKKKQCRLSAFCLSFRFSYDETWHDRWQTFGESIL